MTDSDAVPTAPRAAPLESRLRAYAELLVASGLNLQPGQGLLVRAQTEAAPLVREVAEVAYRRGCPMVEVSWSDEGVTRARFLHAPEGTFERVPKWRADGYLAMAQDGFASLSIASDDPDLLAGTEPERWATYVRTWQRANRGYMEYAMNDSIAWCVAAYAGRAWARKVFPDAPDEVAVARLWDAIFTAVRLDAPDPVAAWAEHKARLEANGARLNGRRYAALRFTGPGTDLRVGLADGHRWEGGGAHTPDGVPFLPNVPTEEIFTAPHSQRVDGVVRASMPLVNGGTVIDDFSLRFEGGRVVEARAGKGQAALERILDTDEGARRLGEVALVPVSSPIYRSGILFYETLFDENAASHIALGRAYPTTVDGGSEMSDDQRRAAGLNDSLTHVDFMIGSEAMDVDGETADGRLEPLMRAGEWVD